VPLNTGEGRVCPLRPGASRAERLPVRGEAAGGVPGGLGGCGFSCLPEARGFGEIPWQGLRVDGAPGLGAVPGTAGLAGKAEPLPRWGGVGGGEGVARERSWACAGKTRSCRLPVPREGRMLGVQRLPAPTA